MHTKVSKSRKALSLSLIFAIMLTIFASAGGLLSQKGDWGAHAANVNNAQYSLQGAVYKVYTNQACTSQAKDVNGNPAQFTTDANGNATSDIELDEGTYYVKETKASKGFILDPTAYKVVVKNGETVWVNGSTVLETPQSVELKVVKKGDNKSWNWPITDAKFKITYTDGAQLTRNWIVKTDANGVASLDDAHFVSGDARYKDSRGKYVVPLGKVTVKEQQSPLGYLINDATKTVNISWGGSTTTSEHDVKITGDINDKNEIVVNETSTAGKLTSLIKVDTSGDNGWRKLLGAEYTLRYYRVNPDTTTDVTGMTPERSWTFKTREMGSGINKSAGIDFQIDEPVSGGAFWTDRTVENDDGTISISNSQQAVMTRILPVGVFTIEETKAPPGLARNKTVYYGKVTQDPNGSNAKTSVLGSDSMIIVDTGELANAEEPTKVVIKIDKKNARTGENTASESEDNHSEGRQGAFSTLAGAEYEVYLDADDVPEPELVGKIVVDENGHGELTERTHGRETHIGKYLPLGNYIIVETKASPGFALDKYEFKDGEQVEVVDGPIEVICGYDADGNPVTKTIEGSREEGKHVFRARMEALNVGEFEYTVSSPEEPTRTYIKKTDAATSKELPGATLQILQDGEVVEEWVSTEEDHIVYELPAGTYTLREITAPYGYDIAEDIEFTVEDGRIVTKCEMQNKPVEVATTAVDVDTNSHQGTISETAKVKDLVKIKGLVAGRKYNVSGRLFNKTTEEFVKDDQGNEVTAESGEFTATAEEMEVELTFEFNSSDFGKETQIVAFEKLERTSPVYETEAVPKEIGGHEDPDDPDQTVNYGGIVETVATDQDQISKNILAGKDTVIVDKVSYKNLSTKETYKLEGELYDKTTGKRTGIKAAAEFTPETSDGFEMIEFKFDSTEYRGHDLVAFEKLFLKTTGPEGEAGKDPEVENHEDPDNEKQTVEVIDYDMYKVRNDKASAKGSKYGFEPGTVVTYDVVIKNVSSHASLTMDVTDKFTEKPEYFSTPEVIDVTGATENSRSSDGNKVNITVEAGKTATVTYAADIKPGAKEYLARAAVDSDSKDKNGEDCNKADQANKTDDKDGYKNLAKADNVTPKDPNNPDKPYKKLPPKDDGAQTPVKIPEKGPPVETGDAVKFVPFITFFAAAIALTIMIIRRRKAAQNR